MLLFQLYFKFCDPVYKNPYPPPPKNKIYPFPIIVYIFMNNPKTKRKLENVLCFINKTNIRQLWFRIHIFCVNNHGNLFNYNIISFNLIFWVFCFNEKKKNKKT